MVPSDDVGLGLHALILHTKEYAQLCERYTGRFLHHNPKPGGGGHDPEKVATSARAMKGRRVPGLRRAVDRRRHEPRAVRRGLRPRQVLQEAPVRPDRALLPVIIRAALQHAVREAELPHNVARNIDLSMGTKREIEPFTAKEGRQLLAAAHDNRLLAAYELAVHIGLRRGELLGLRWSDADLHEGVLTVRQALQRVGGELLIVAQKTYRSARRVALPAECVTALRAQRTQQIADRKGASSRLCASAPAFARSASTPSATPARLSSMNRSPTLA